MKTQKLFWMHLGSTTAGRGDTERGCGEAQPQRQQITRGLRSLQRSCPFERAAAGLRHSRAPVQVFSALIPMIILLGSVIPHSVFASNLPRVTNVSPSPQLTNEFYLTATNVTMFIKGTPVKVLVYKDDPPGGGGAPAQIPSPLIEATVGQTIICHFRNKLTNNIEGASIHWHGIELDNESDGTGVTQDTIFSGQTYTYRFIVPRSGLYWYHSHMLPGTTTFGGMYGPMIVHDTNETALIAAGVLPPTNRTFQLMMSDISFTNGVVGKVWNGTNFSLNTLIQLCENSILGHPNANGSACAPAGIPGDIFLCNGEVPSRGGSFCAPIMDSRPFFLIGKNQRVRLQLFNASISRNCYLTLKYPCSSPTGDTNLYHIGGQGGLLDKAVLDGGVQNGYDFHYGKGTANIGSGEREDVMFYSSGNAGDVIQLLGYPLGAPWKLTGSSDVGTNYPVAFFIITNGGPTDAVLTNGSPILTAVGASNEDLRLASTNSVAPPPFAAFGTQSGYIELKNNQPINGVITGPNIGNYAATALDGNSGNGAWPDVPHPPSAIWARAGDVLQLAIANNTGTGGGGGSATHPYHLHGFSMQPIAIYSANLQTNLFTYPYNQFVDTWDILPGEALVFRIKLEDRPVLADTATGGPLTLGKDSPAGGNIGRWLMHCHIFLHGAVGMISELVVMPNSATRLVGPTSGTNSVIYAGGSSWTATANEPWLHLPPGFATGSGSTNVLFTFDANPGATRVGTLSIGGMTVSVTQAGTNYVQAPGPVTTLATNTVLDPAGVAVDEEGNVYFSDGFNNAIKRWNRQINSVTTLVSGLGEPQGLALDGVGNVYFADFNSTAIRMWSAKTHQVSTVFNNNTIGVSGLAVDNAGNVYITVPGQRLVKKWTASTGVLSSFTTNGLTGFVGPYGVAVDAAGAVYVTDTKANEIKKLGTRTIIIITTPLVIPYWNTVVSSTNLNEPWGVAVDDGGNIYIGDGFNNAIKRFNYASNKVETLVSSGLSDPGPVAVDRKGNLYIADFDHNAIKELPYAFVDPTPRFETAEVTQDTLPGILMPDQNLFPPFAPVSSAFFIQYNGSSNGVVKFSVTGNLGGPRTGTLTVLGQPITINQAGASFGVGTTNLLVGPAAGINTVTEFVSPSIAFFSASTATPWLHLPVTAGTGSTNLLFTYDANPGPTRTGTLTINGKTVTVTQAGSSYVQAPGPLTSLVSSGLSEASGLTVDSLGNVIFCDSDNQVVSRWSPANNSVTGLINGGLSIPEGVAADGAGNVYVADFGNHGITERRAFDGSLFTLVNDSPNFVASVSLDSATNVYWSGPTDNAVKKRTASSGSVSSLVSSNLNAPNGIAVDVAGNIFIADTGNNAIKKWNPATASLTTLGTNGIRTPLGVAVDGSGNVYIANGGSNNIVEWVAATGAFVTRVPAGGVIFPTGVSVDANQNVYIADFGNGAIKELPYAFVDPAPKFEPATAGRDSLPMVLPSVQSLRPPFAPVSSQPWLTIGSTAGGVVDFGFTANTNTVPRTAVITLLGQDILVQQKAAVYPPVISGITKSNGVFQLGFTNGTPGATYSVLFSTNVNTPLSNWTLIGTVFETTSIGRSDTVSPHSVWQFTDTHATNEAGFYTIRFP